MSNASRVGREKVVVLLCALAFTIVARSEESGTTKPGPDGIGYFSPTVKRGGESVEIALARFRESDFELLVIDNGSSRAKSLFKNLGDAMQQSRCEAGTNGGFFDIASFQPNGLMIAEGRSAGQYDPKNWAEGVLAIRAGVPVLANREGFAVDATVTGLLQTGPWLVRRGDSKADFTNDETPHRRTFIATDGRGTWLLGFVSGVTLKELGALLRSETIRDIMTVQDALNLDGGPSSGFWIRRGESHHYVEEGTMVRNFVGVRRR
jgi:uncharacterized protein YigE (DUF2233 family)